jgi:hypothetical protein
MGVAVCADDLKNYSLRSRPQVNDIHEQVCWATLRADSSVCLRHMVSDG